MDRSRGRRFLLGLGLIGGLAIGEVRLRADDGLRARPESVSLRGPEAVQQLAIADPIGRDLTATASFRSEDPTIAEADALGGVSARGEGTTAVVVSVGDRRVRVPVTVRDVASPPPIDFAESVVPLFTKLGCNAGGCHGKASGQNGFRLSLLGFEPELDYQTIVEEGRGRRVFPASPERSLLRAKAVGDVPHGGGRRLVRGSIEDRILRRWIASGMPRKVEGAARVARIVIDPPGDVLAPNDGRQLLVSAVYGDGSTEDVTRRAQFQSNEPELASVSDGGRVEARASGGSAAVMARYQGLVAVYRATVPRNGGGAEIAGFEPANFVDELVSKRWKTLGLTPSGPPPTPNSSAGPAWTSPGRCRPPRRSAGSSPTPRPTSESS